MEPRKCSPNHPLDLLQNIPVMSATVLALDNLLHDPCVDLQRAAQLILSDVGATIQILRVQTRRCIGIGHRSLTTAAGKVLHQAHKKKSHRETICDATTR